MREKLRQKALVGGTPGWVPPGYVNVGVQFEGRKVNTVELDPERAPFVPLAFEWFATGQYTYDELRDALFAAGFTSRPNRARPAGKVSRHTVEHMLRRYYLGYVTVDGVEYQGRHPTLVTPELFERVQQVLRTMPGAGNRQRRYHHYLKSLVWCRRCHRRLIVMRGRSKTGQLYFYFICRGRQQKVCNLPYIRASHLEQAVAAHYHSVVLPPELRQKLIDLFDQAVEQRAGDTSKDRTRLRRRLTELDRQEDRYIELALDPEWPKAKLTEKLRSIRDERARLDAELNQTVEQLEAGRRNARRVLDYLEQPVELYERGGTADKAKLNRLLFTKLLIDVSDETGVKVVADELTDPFMTVVYLRREFHPVPILRAHGNGKGGAPGRDTAFHDRVLALLEPALRDETPQSSSNSTLAEDRGFEPLRDCSQPAFQASAIGH